MSNFFNKFLITGFALFVILLFAVPANVSALTVSADESLRIEPDWDWAGVEIDGFATKGNNGGTIYNDQEFFTTVSPANPVAAFPFTVQDAGYYTLRGRVRAPSGDENSFYVGMDDFSSNLEDNVWHVPVQNNLGFRTVEFNGETARFALTEGQHILVLVGREPNTELNRWIIEYDGPLLEGDVTPTPDPTPTDPDPVDPVDPDPIPVDPASDPVDPDPTPTDPGLETLPEITTGASSTKNLRFEAENGIINGFVSKGGAMYNPVEDYLTSAGAGPKAGYTFTVDEAGIYDIYGLVKASDSSHNSFYVSIDRVPDVTHRWDTRSTGEYNKEKVVWRGSDDEGFKLTRGTHFILVSGRETETFVDKWYLEYREPWEDAPVPVQDTNITITDTTGSPTNLGLGWELFHLPVGQTSGTGYFNVTNTGTSDFIVEEVKLYGPHANDFTIVEPLPATIAPGQTGRLGIQATPSALGERLAYINLTGNIAIDTVTLELVGEGLSGGTTDPDPEPTDPDVTPVLVPVTITDSTGSPTNRGLGAGLFELPIGQTSGTGYFFITNTGTSDLEIEDTLLYGADASDFTIVEPLPATISPSQTGRLGIQATPSALGERLAYIDLSGNFAEGSPVTLELVGAGIVDGTDPTDPGPVEGPTVSKTVSATVEAENGTLTGFATDGTAIYNNISEMLDPGQSNPTATYPFYVSEAGTYDIHGLVKADSDKQNSFFVTVDNEATLNDIWDTGYSNQYSKEKVIHRNSYDTGFDLEAGQHVLIVTGREVSTFADKWYIEYRDTTQPTPGPTPAPDISPLPKNSDGFTRLNPTNNSRLVHVSTSGNDNVACDVATANNPVKSLNRAYECIRNGNPDWILLKSGDTWVNQQFENWGVYSFDAKNPVVVTSYGNGKRPLIIPASGKNGFDIRPGDKNDISGLAIVGLHIYGRSRDLSSPYYVSRSDEAEGINVRLTGQRDSMRMTGLLFEDNYIENFDTNIRVVDDWSRQELNRRLNGAPLSDTAPGCDSLAAASIVKGQTCPGRVTFTAHRNILRYAHSSGSHSVGMYVEGTRDSIITENFIDHSGYHPLSFEDRNKKSHGIYSQEIGGPVTAKGNISARSAANCAQFRSGADAEDNLCVEPALGFWVGRNDSKVNRNVLIHTRDIFKDSEIPGLLDAIARGEEKPGQGLRGKGFHSQDMPSGASIEVFDNLVVHKGGSLGGKIALSFFASSLTHGGNIIHDWIPVGDNRPETDFNGDTSGITNRNIVTKSNEANLHVDASRNVNTYAQKIGIGNSKEDFYEAVAARKAGDWIPSLTSYAVYDYLKAGYKLKSTASLGSTGSVAGARTNNISLLDLGQKLQKLNISNQTITEVINTVFK